MSHPIPTKTYTKECEVCGKELPEDFGNLLCLQCYDNLSKKKEEEQKKEEATPFHEPNPAEKIIQEARKLMKEQPNREEIIKTYTGNPADYGISDPLYAENPEREELNMVKRTAEMFERTRMALWNDRVSIYNFIKNYAREHTKAHPQFPKFIWRPKIADVGCGIGTGSNILSQEADFVWGIDKSVDNICWATQCYSRYKNGIYYSSQVSFEVVDILDEKRELMQFDIIAAIELIEHVYETDKVVAFLKRLSKKDKNGKYITREVGEDGEWGTVTFISSPNRNNDNIHKDRPYNPYHVREHTLLELKTYLQKHWENVQALHHQGYPIEDTSDVSPVLFKCTRPI